MTSTSDFSKQLMANAGIVDLMSDLGRALNVNPDMLFLGGGNPARIPAFEQRTAEHLATINQDSEALHRLIGVYQSPQGDERFIRLLAEYFQSLDWPVTERNICLTAGSQSAFFMLLNMFAGQFENGQKRKVALPFVPEYLGYADQGLSRDMFVSCRPEIELIGKHTFKYQPDFSALAELSHIGAVCLSRPTNPSANMISDASLAQLGEFADKRGIPLIVDCAYGHPFPGVVYTQANSRWQTNRIFVMSLSKLGMPAVRTGIVIADEPIINQLVNANTVMSLANGNLGPALMTEWLASGDLSDTCANIIKPFYERKKNYALQLIANAFSDLNYRVHQPDGAFFLWLWFPGLKGTSTQLFEALKARSVLVMDGVHFFFEHSDWDHAQQCIRITYCADDAVLEQAITIIAEELRRLA